jgi:hypothetical protein
VKGNVEDSRVQSVNSTTIQIQGSAISADLINETSTSEKRVSSQGLRRKWEEANETTWPKDPATGKNQDVAHKKPLADGDTNELDNYGPQPHSEHVKEHQENGDFSRWDSRSHQNNDASND